MLKIRLARVGKKKQPTYRVVVADARAPRDGAYVEIIGHYNPRTEPTTFVIDGDKVKDWMAKGAQPTDRVEKLLANEGLVPARDWGAASLAAAAKREANKRTPRAAAPEAPAAAAPATATAVAEAPAAEPQAEAASEPEAVTEPEAEPEAAEAEPEAATEAAPEAAAEPEPEAAAEPEPEAEAEANEEKAGA
ncbi:MAG: 30S ribosomal protein S16 [Dehalococcoidia bacterium]|nr:30S ribosomal protein S16 [Dehalococcoidia bacterium]